MTTNDSIESGALKVLLARSKLALGSMALVEKQLLEICTVVDNLIENVYDEPIRGEEEKLDTDFFITPSLEVYE